MNPSEPPISCILYLLKKLYGITYLLNFSNSDGGNKKCNRTWNLIVFRLNGKMEPLLNEPMASLPIQVMAEQRWSKTTKRTHNEEHESSTVQSFLEWAEKHPNISENKKLKMVDLLRKKQ